MKLLFLQSRLRQYLTSRLFRLLTWQLWVFLVVLCITQHLSTQRSLHHYRAELSGQGHLNAREWVLYQQKVEDHATDSLVSTMVVFVLLWVFLPEGDQIKRLIFHWYAKAQLARPGLSDDELAFFGAMLLRRDET